MGPLEITAAYRQQQLLDEARAEGLARSARAAGPVATPAATAGLLSRLVHSAWLVRDARRAAPRKASI